MSGTAEDWRPTTDVLAAEPEEPSRRAAPWPLVGGIAVLVLALVGGVTYAVGSLSGGGTQPAEALPSGAFALVSVDLDPPAGQKIDGFRFLRKFPALRDKVPLDGDVREVLFDAVAEDAGWEDVDFDQDVAPWMGKRVAFAAYPPEPGAGNSDEPLLAVALQVTDQGAADAGLRRLTREAENGEEPGWAFSGDYALITETTRVAESLAGRVADGTLAEDENFAGDMADADADDSFAVFWLDAGTAAATTGSAAADLGMGLGAGVLGAASGATGRSTLVARFDGPDVFELEGRAVGVQTGGWASHPVQGMADLPESSVVALGLADGDELVPRAYEAMRTSFGEHGEDLDAWAAELEDDLGISVPDDIATLFGDNLLAALDGTDSETVEIGARVTTDVPAAESVIDKLVGGDDFAVARRRVGDDLVVAATKTQADRLAADGTLGDLPAFRDAVEDGEDAHLVVWVDPAGLANALFGQDGSPDEDLAAIGGIGITVSSPDEDQATFRLRLVAR